MKAKLILLPILLLSVKMQAQDSTRKSESGIPDKIVAYCERMPEPGYNIHDFLGENLHYPPNAYKNDITGKVNVVIVVDTIGNIHYLNVSKSDDVDTSLIEEAIRVVKLMPAWEKPGLMKGMPVNVYYTIPINFEIEKGLWRKRKRSK